AALDSTSGWQRDLAQQMLLWRNDRAAVGQLENLAAGSARPQARLHALCTLDGLGALTTAAVQQALEDPHPGVRRHAVRLCEGFLKKERSAVHQSEGPAPPPGDALLRRIEDKDPQVQLQLA